MKRIATSRCTVINRKQAFCDAPSIPESPFPICGRHATELYGFLRDTLDAADPFAGIPTMSVITEVPQHFDGRQVVYYLRSGLYIKIGRTGDVRRRMYHYQPGVELVALEPGGYELEQQRHAEFEHLRVGQREWFSAGPELVAHVVGIRESHGVPA